MFTKKQNATQRQSFAYAKKSPNGYYIVVEAVGGKRNPNVVPVMIIQFDESKWNKMIVDGKVLGEILYENDFEKYSNLDIAKIKKNRVTVAQFASKKPLLNTPRSPQFNNIIPHSGENVNTKFSLPSNADYAPAFYSHMGKVVDGIKSEKVGANGVVSYLKGKGVKDEEIKWSGIEAFLEGKKSVTKARNSNQHKYCKIKTSVTDFLPVTEVSDSIRLR